MRKSFYLFLVVFLLSIPGLSQSSTQTFTTVEGTQIKFEIIAAKDTVMFGEPTYYTVKVSNPSDKSLCPEFSNFSNSHFRGYKLKTVRDDGKFISEKMTTDGGFYKGCDDKSTNGSYFEKRFYDLFAESNEAARDYTFSIILRVSMTNYQTRVTNNFSGEISVKVKMIPTDQTKLGEVIDSLGKRMLDRDEDAATLLLFTPDSRAMKYHLQVLKEFKDSEDTKDKSDKFIRNSSIRALGRFNDETAFEAVKNEMKSPNLHTRLSALHALSRSPHPQAFELFWTMRNDEAPLIRMQIVMRIDAVKNDESTARLREMLKDSDAGVRSDVQLRLKLRGQK